LKLHKRTRILGLLALSVFLLTAGMPAAVFAQAPADPAAAGAQGAPQGGAAPAAQQAPGNAQGGTAPAGTSPAAPQAAGTASPADNVLTLYVNQAKVVLNGKAYPSPQPTLVKNGASYAPLSMLAARYGYTIRFDAAAKEAVAQSGDTELRFKDGSGTYKLNGATFSASGKPFTLKGSLMIPVRSWADATHSALKVAKGQIQLSWSIHPTADFTVTPAEEVHATQTEVTYTLTGKHPERIVNERWEGQEKIFAEPGPHVITHWVQDDTGTWSAPYSVTINVLPPNQPPVAMFTTNKDTYKIGEPIELQDVSTDDENAITSRQFTGWDPAEPVFFDPGEHRISLLVMDKHGETSVYTKTITITNEVMYTREQYRMHFTPVGEKYPIDGPGVLKYETVPYSYMTSERVLVASDSPEQLDREGVLYRDTLSGDFRLFLYHENQSGQPLKLYLAAMNEGTAPAVVTLGPWGKAGPDSFGALTGKLAAMRYLDQLESGTSSAIQLAPGETKLIVPELGAQPLKQGQIFSFYADMNASSPVKFTLYAVKPDRDPIAALANLWPLPRDGKHIRGTFPGADRFVTITPLLGERPQRVVFGDHSIDPVQSGVDTLNGQPASNWGNFGIRYHTMVRVKANTLIAVNARGGIYSGVFKINGQHVLVSNSSMLKDPNEACVLYRTGAYDETLEISFLTALGSNLPMNILFLPLEEGDPSASSSASHSSSAGNSVSTHIKMLPKENGSLM